MQLVVAKSVGINQQGEIFKQPIAVNWISRTLLPAPLIGGRNLRQGNLPAKIIIVDI